MKCLSHREGSGLQHSNSHLRSGQRHGWLAVRSLKIGDVPKRRLKLYYPNIVRKFIVVLRVNRYTVSTPLLLIDVDPPHYPRADYWNSEIHASRGDDPTCNSCGRFVAEHSEGTRKMNVHFAIVAYVQISWQCSRCHLRQASLQYSCPNPRTVPTPNIARFSRPASTSNCS